MKPPDLDLETGLPVPWRGRAELFGAGAEARPGFGASVPGKAWQSSAPVPAPLRQSGAATVNATPAPSRIRVTVDGKGFRLGPAKFHAKGVTYGPLPPGADGVPFAAPEATRKDFAQILELGANLLRVYHVPPRWFLDLAHEHGLKLLVDVAWNRHQCFLDSTEAREETLERVREAARRCAGHPAVFALSVANEIPADIVRWSGADAVTAFLDELIRGAKAEDPELLCTFGNFPTTEFLQAETADFQCFNVYLHDRQPFDNYLARLQMLSDTRPLMLGEIGIDTIREGEARQSEVLHWKIESAFRSGCAGVVVYSFTDQWWHCGRIVEDWAFGLTRSDRTPKPAFETVRRQFGIAPYFPLPATPKVSVVIASYNGATTLKTCLQSLEHLNYPDYEVILVDDGSTDATPSIAALFPGIVSLRHAQNLGLGAARNTGIEAATGVTVLVDDTPQRGGAVRVRSGSPGSRPSSHGTPHPRRPDSPDPHRGNRRGGEHRNGGVCRPGRRGGDLPGGHTAGAPGGGADAGPAALPP